MIVKLLTEHRLGFLSLKGGCRGSSESTLVKMSNCWKSHTAAHIIMHEMIYMISDPVMYLYIVVLLIEKIEFCNFEINFV